MDSGAVGSRTSETHRNSKDQAKQSQKGKKQDTEEGGASAGTAN